MATAVAAGCGGEYAQVIPRAALSAFDLPEIGPEEVDFFECHDAAAPAELIGMEEVGLCGPREAIKLLRNGETSLRGRLPVNTSGGLQSRATPLARPVSHRSSS